MKSRIGAAVLSHRVETFAMVSAFFLFSIGCLNILLVCCLVTSYHLYAEIGVGSHFPRERKVQAFHHFLEGWFQVHTSQSHARRTPRLYFPASLIYIRHV